MGAGKSLMNRRKYSNGKLKNWATAYLFIMPALIGAFYFGFYPLFRSIGMAFTKWNGMTEPIPVGLANFTRLFKDPKFYFELRNTFAFAFISVPISLSISFIIAVALNGNRGPIGTMRVIYFLPYVTMPVAIAAVWRWMFNDRAGLINTMIEAIGIKGPRWISSPEWILTSLIIVTVWSSLGYNITIILAGLKNIPKAYYEAAEIDGAGKTRSLFSITLPLVTPSLFFLSITSLIGAFKSFDLIYMFTGNESPVNLVNASRTMVFGIFENSFKFMEMGYGTAEAAILLMIILLITMVQFVVQKFWVSYDT